MGCCLEIHPVCHTILWPTIARQTVHQYRYLPGVGSTSLRSSRLCFPLLVESPRGSPKSESHCDSVTLWIKKSLGVCPCAGRDRCCIIFSTSSSLIFRSFLLCTRVVCSGTSTRRLKAPVAHRLDILRCDGLVGAVCCARASSTASKRKTAGSVQWNLAQLSRSGRACAVEGLKGFALGAQRATFRHPHPSFSLLLPSLLSFCFLFIQLFCAPFSPITTY